jgi:hypothetical protein
MSFLDLIGKSDDYGGLHHRQLIIVLERCQRSGKV